MNLPIKFKFKSPKLLSQQIRKCYHKTLGTSVINNPLSHLALPIMTNNYFNTAFNTELKIGFKKSLLYTFDLN